MFIHHNINLDFFYFHTVILLCSYWNARYPYSLIDRRCVDEFQSPFSTIMFTLCKPLFTHYSHSINVLIFTQIKVSSLNPVAKVISKYVLFLTLSWPSGIT